MKFSIPLTSFLKLLCPHEEISDEYNNIENYRDLKWKSRTSEKNSKE